MTRFQKLSYFGHRLFNQNLIQRTGIMKTATLLDIFLNALLPLLTGGLCYLPLFRSTNLPLLTNHLADALWAYAFMSLLLIVWERKPNVVWMTAPFVIAAGFECLQGRHLIAGTGDVADVAVYFFSFILSLYFNSFFKARLAA